MRHCISVDTNEEELLHSRALFIREAQRAVAEKTRRRRLGRMREEGEGSFTTGLTEGYGKSGKSDKHIWQAAAHG